MTSWSVVCSISAIRSTSTRRARLERRERLGRDQAARGLGAGDRQLDPEHRLEPGRLGPDRAHLGERVAADHRGAPGCGRRRRRCEADVVAALDAGEGDRVGGRLGRGRAAARSGPRPTTERTRPPAVRTVPSGPMVGAGVEDERAVGRGHVEAVDRVAVSEARPGSRRSRARSRPSRPGTAGSRAVGEPECPGGAGQLAAGGGQQERPERDGQARQERLRLGVAEAGVALEQDRAVVGQHQAGVQRATERGAAAGQLGEDRPVEGLQERRDRRRRRGPGAGCRRPCRRCSAPRRRRAGACGRGPAGSASASRPSHEGDEARLAAASRSSTTTRAPRAASAAIERARRLVEVVADRHALAGGQPVGLDHDAVAGRRELARERQRRLDGRERRRAGHPHAGGRGDLVAERLAALDPGGRLRRPEDRDPGRSRAHRRRRPPAAPPGR